MSSVLGGYRLASITKPLLLTQPDLSHNYFDQMGLTEARSEGEGHPDE